MSSETRTVTLGPAPVALPGTPSLSPAQVAANPVTLSWSPGAGGTPSSYTVYAGTSPGASNLAVAPMGGATSITAVAPVGTPIYVRVVATNAAGSATSNEVQFTVAAPALARRPDVVARIGQRRQRHTLVGPARIGRFAHQLLDPGAAARLGGGDCRAAGDRHVGHGARGSGHLSRHHRRHQRRGLERGVESDHRRRSLIALCHNAIRLPA